jgi:hypothetical protein
MAQGRELALYDLFFHKEELLPLWLRLRASVEGLGSDVHVHRRGR